MSQETMSVAHPDERVVVLSIPRNIEDFAQALSQERQRCYLSGWRGMWQRRRRH